MRRQTRNLRVVDRWLSPLPMTPRGSCHETAVEEVRGAQVRELFDFSPIRT